MKGYVIYWVDITLPKYSTDGKRHRHILYYEGVKSIGGFSMMSWDRTIKTAKVYTSKRDAERALRELPEPTAKIKEVARNE